MKLLTSFLLAIVSVFAPAGAVLAVTLTLVIVDLVTGVIAAKKRGESITSRNLRRSVTKLAVYEVAILLSFLTGQYLITEMPVLKIVTSLIGLTELRSVLENLSVIWDSPIVQMLISRLGGPEVKK